MARYIDADKLKETLKNLKPGGYASSVLGKITLQIIDDTSTTDVVEVKHGHWIKRGNEKKCSVCGFIYYSNNDDWNGCPNCLAKMDVSKMEITTEGSKEV